MRRILPVLAVLALVIPAQAAAQSYHYHHHHRHHHHRHHGDAWMAPLLGGLALGAIIGNSLAYPTPPPPVIHYYHPPSPPVIYHQPPPPRYGHQCWYQGIGWTWCQ